MPWRITWHPPAPTTSGESSFSLKFAHCLRIVFVIGKYAHIFWWCLGDEFSDGGIFHGENFPWEGKFSEGKFFMWIITLGEFTTFPLRNSSYVLFLFVDSSLRMEVLRVNVRGKFFTRLNCLEDIIVGRRDLSEEVEPDFLALLKKDQKLNKNKFFKLKHKKQLKLKANRNYHVYEGVAPSSAPCCLHWTLNLSQFFKKDS